MRRLDSGQTLPDVSQAQSHAARERPRQDAEIRAQSQARVPASGNALLLLQRSHGNLAVRDLIGRLRRGVVTVQRDPPAAGASTGPAPTRAAFDRAFHLVATAPDDQLPVMHRQLQQAMAQTGDRSMLISLQLGGECIVGFSSDRLPELIDLAGRVEPTNRRGNRNFERAQRDAQARIQAEQYARQAAQLRVATDRYLRELDQPRPAPGGSGWLIHDQAGNERRVSETELQSLRQSIVPHIRRLLSGAEAWQSTAQERRAREYNPLTSDDYRPSQQRSWAASESIGAASQQLAMGRNARLAIAFMFATSALEQARAASESATSAATTTARMEAAVTLLRGVRDGCIAILATGVTVATGGTAGAIAGAVVGSTLGAGAAAQDQLLERGRVDWGEIATGAVASAGVSAILGIPAGRVTAAFERAISSRLTVMLAQPAVQQRLTAYSRETVVRVVSHHIVERSSRVALNHLTGVAGTAASGLARGLTDEQIAAEINRQTTWQAWLTAAITDAAVQHTAAMGRTAPAAPAAPQTTGPQADGGTTTRAAARPSTARGRAPAPRAPADSPSLREPGEREAIVPPAPNAGPQAGAAGGGQARGSSTATGASAPATPPRPMRGQVPRSEGARVTRPIRAQPTGRVFALSRGMSYDEAIARFRSLANMAREREVALLRLRNGTYAMIQGEAGTVRHVEAAAEVLDVSPDDLTWIAHSHGDLRALRGGAEPTRRDWVVSACPSGSDADMGLWVWEMEQTPGTVRIERRIYVDTPFGRDWTRVTIDLGAPGRRIRVQFPDMRAANQTRVMEFDSLRTYDAWLRTNGANAPATPERELPPRTQPVR